MMDTTNARPAHPFPLAHLVMGEGADLEQLHDKALDAYEAALAPTPAGQPEDENLVADLRGAMRDLVQATLAVGALEGRDVELHQGLGTCLDSRLTDWLPEGQAKVSSALVESWLNYLLKQFALTSLPEWRNCLATGGYERLLAGLSAIKGDSRDQRGNPTESCTQRMTVVAAAGLAPSEYV